jgi:hypothetical protein
MVSARTLYVYLEWRPDNGKPMLYQTHPMKRGMFEELQDEFDHK